MPTSEPVTACALRSSIRFPLQAVTHGDIPLQSGTPGSELFDLDAGTVTQTQVAPSIATWGQSCCKGPHCPQLFPLVPGNRVKAGASLELNYIKVHSVSTWAAPRSFLISRPRARQQEEAKSHFCTTFGGNYASDLEATWWLTCASTAGLSKIPLPAGSGCRTFWCGAELDGYLQ